ncbi:MAG: class I SAM-dependent methyltransferase [Candidatus Pseudobacter hemicellulosilyticus]|uniref:Class I SAM-dependent methyltransferase n=1 Tax=Candidatus Pseudobacter hemicellulosilyticus TaxID=3121375 RepID=A0AAJ5WQZ5_9BACT|nr:MAG: class I SAM-dependent methyltransferase [Pseudobacter sp.]
MYSRWQLAQKFIRYYLTASNGKGHGVHSPFVYEFIVHVLNDTTVYDAYSRVENLRNTMLTEKDLIEVEDMGAGSTSMKSRQRSIAAIARHAAKPAKWAQLLYRIVNYYQPETIIELGTSLGISTAYMALANPHGYVMTAEGSPSIAAEATRNFIEMGLNNVELMEGHFDETLPEMLQKLTPLDMAFIDGNHRKKPTLQYFEQILEHTHNFSVIILDDIHWSKEMEQAWDTIRQHPRVRLTIDLFFVGLVFFREEFKEKQHFSIRF